VLLAALLIQLAMQLSLKKTKTKNPFSRRAKVNYHKYKGIASHAKSFVLLYLQKPAFQYHDLKRNGGQPFSPKGSFLVSMFGNHETRLGEGDRLAPVYLHVLTASSY
jgi:hypothetical protein